MKHLKNLDRAILMEMLVTETNRYLRMLRMGTLFEDYEECKSVISEIMFEIRRREPWKYESVEALQTEQKGENNG